MAPVFLGILNTVFLNPVFSEPLDVFLQVGGASVKVARSVLIPLFQSLFPLEGDPDVAV